MNIVLAMPLMILLYGFLKLPENTSCNSPNHKKRLYLTAVSKTAFGIVIIITMKITTIIYVNDNVKMLMIIFRDIQIIILQ